MKHLEQMENRRKDGRIMERMLYGLEKLNNALKRLLNKISEKLIVATTLLKYSKCYDSPL